MCDFFALGIHTRMVDYCQAGTTAAAEAIPLAEYVAELLRAYLQPGAAGVAAREQLRGARGVADALGRLSRRFGSGALPPGITDVLQVRSARHIASAPHTAASRK